MGDIIKYFYEDCVAFKYKLIKNGVLIHNDLELLVPAENYFSTATKDGDYDYLSGRMTDYTRNVSAPVNIKLINQNKILFNLSSGTYNLRNPISYYENTPNEKLFNIPTDGIEMVKVN